MIIADDLASFAKNFSHLMREDTRRTKKAEILHITFKEETVTELKKVLEN